MKISFFTFALLFGFISTAQAQSSSLPVSPQSSVSSSSSQVDISAEKIKSDDLDKEISDIKLRASSGAKRKYSTSLNFSYSGASLHKPGDDVRPNVGKSPVTPPVALTGDFGFRYRFNKNESIFLATGFRQARPFHSREQDEDLEINSPYLGYNNTSAKGDWQVGSSVRLYITTHEEFRAIGEVATLGYSLSALTSVGQTRLSLGASANIWGSAFDKDQEDLPFYMQSSQRDYGVSLMPTLQYNKNGRVNFYTSLKIFNFSHIRGNSFFEMEDHPTTQTAGLGFAIVRDFYLSPFLSFEPEDIRADKTTVNLSASINL